MEGVGWIGDDHHRGLAGWIAEKVMKQRTWASSATSCSGSSGALVLNFVLIQLVGMTYPGWIGQLIVGAIGACILIFLGRLIRGRTA